MGAVFVEALLVLPILLTIVLITIQYGMVLSAEITLKNASAIAARAAILDGLTSSQVEAVARSAVVPSLKTDAASLQVSVTDTVVNAITAKRVVLQYQYPLFAPMLIAGSSGGKLPLRAETIMR